MLAWVHLVQIWAVHAFARWSVGLVMLALEGSGLEMLPLERSGLVWTGLGVLDQELIDLVPTVRPFCLRIAV